VQCTGVRRSGREPESRQYCIRSCLSRHYHYLVSVQISNFRPSRSHSALRVSLSPSLLGDPNPLSAAMGRKNLGVLADGPPGRVHAVARPVLLLSRRQNPLCRSCTYRHTPLQLTNRLASTEGSVMPCQLRHHYSRNRILR
jgi:hypothetical protein